jgi:hypothetical protein
MSCPSPIFESSSTMRRNEVARSSVSRELRTPRRPSATGDARSNTNAARTFDHANGTPGAFANLKRRFERADGALP